MSFQSCSILNLSILYKYRFINEYLYNLLYFVLSIEYEILEFFFYKRDMKNIERYDKYDLKFIVIYTIHLIC